MNECMNDAPEDGDEESCRQVGDAEGDSRLVLALVASGDCGSRGYADDPAEYLVSVCYFMACLKNQEQLQGDPSGLSQPTVDIKTNVVFQNMLLMLKRNFCFDVNSRLGPT